MIHVYDEEGNPFELVSDENEVHEYGKAQVATRIIYGSGPVPGRIRRALGAAKDVASRWSSSVSGALDKAAGATGGKWAARNVIEGLETGGLKLGAALEKGGTYVRNRAHVPASLLGYGRRKWTGGPLVARGVGALGGGIRGAGRFATAHPKTAIGLAAGVPLGAAGGGAAYARRRKHSLEDVARTYAIRQGEDERFYVISRTSGRLLGDADTMTEAMDLEQFCFDEGIG